MRDHLIVVVLNDNAPRVVTKRPHIVNNIHQPGNVYYVVIFIPFPTHFFFDDDGVDAIPFYAFSELTKGVDGNGCDKNVSISEPASFYTGCVMDGWVDGE